MVPMMRALHISMRGAPRSPLLCTTTLSVHPLSVALPVSYPLLHRARFCTVAVKETEEASAVRGAEAYSFLYFESPTHDKFVNMLMKHGKKQTARRIMWDAFTRIRDSGKDPQEVFSGALDQARPLMEMRTFGRGGQVPFPLSPQRAEGFAMKWLVAAARKRKSRAGMGQGLSQELMQAHMGQGAAVQKRESVHKQAVANQAAAHYRWSGGSSQAAGAIDMERKLFRPQGRRFIKKLQRL